MTTLAARPGSTTRAAERPARIGPLGRLADLAFRHRGAVVLAWLAVMVLATGLSIGFAGKYRADYSAPGSDSKAASDLLSQRFPEQGGESVTIVVRAEGGIAAARADLTGMLDRMRSVHHVTAVEDPFTSPGALAPDGTTARVTAKLDVSAEDLPVADAQAMLDIASQTSDSRVRVALGGYAIERAQRGSIGSEELGMIAALLILLLMFGSVVAAGLPVLMALAGLAISTAATALVVHVVDAPDWSSTMATMLGIGLGVDYALLMVTRFRQWRAAGLDERAATVATLDTAGRSVVVAGTTVVISMLGLFAMGLSFMRGAAVVSILAVLIVMAASITLFPALLGYLGRHVDRLRLPVGRGSAVTVGSGGTLVPSRWWTRWSTAIQRHRLIAALVGVAALLVIASPFLGARFGFPDAGNDRASTSTRQAYDLLERGFGAGANGPLVVAAELPASASATQPASGSPVPSAGGSAAQPADASAAQPAAGSAAVLDRLAGALRGTTGVAAVLPTRLNPAGDTAVITVLPTTGPQAKATENLVERLRDQVIPAAVRDTGIRVHVGGVTASAIDTNANIASRIPLLITGVVLLSMVLLLVSFRSVVVAVKAAVMNLLSVAAAYGVVALVLQGGTAGRLVGIDTESPLPAFVPVLMFAGLFGLSMDYEVFLVSRMREAWVRTGDNGTAITDGLAGTGRVISAAAAIMVAVFAAFVPSDDLVIKMIGIGMAAAILIDATVIRLVLVPAVMHILGRANWWLPRWLDQIVPQLHVEGRPQDHLIN